MSVRELKRQEVMSRVSRKEIALRDAAALMEVSYRQAKRIWKRYRTEGAQGLVHQSAGRPSSRGKPAEFRKQVLSKVREKYSGEIGQRFGPTLTAEHLSSDDGLKIHAETLRRWMLEAGLWSRARKHKPHRKRRERRQHFGVSAIRWQPARLVRRAGIEVLLDEYGRGCNQPDGSYFQRTGEHLGGGGSAAELGQEVGDSEGAVYGLEERVRERTEPETGVARRSSADAVWANVRAAGDPYHCRQFAPSERARGAESRHSPGSAD